MQKKTSSMTQFPSHNDQSVPAGHHDVDSFQYEISLSRNAWYVKEHILWARMDLSETTPINIADKMFPLKRTYVTDIVITTSIQLVIQIIVFKYQYNVFITAWRYVIMIMPLVVWCNYVISKDYVITSSHYNLVILIDSGLWIV